MALKFHVLVVLSIILLGFTVEGEASKSKDKKHKKDERSSYLILPKPEKLFKSKVGNVLVWPEYPQAFEEIRVRVEIIELESNGLVLPMYSDADNMCYVVQGRANAGIIKPSGQPTSVRYVRTGDMVAIPAGWTTWMWNTARITMRMFCVSKPTLQADCGSCETYFLAGGKDKKGGAFLHGFSDEVLSRMWNVNEKEARKVVESQKDAVMASTEESNDSGSENDAIEGDLAFNMQIAHPEKIEGGSRMTVLDDSKMKALKELSFGAVLVKLDSMSMFAPQWTPSAGQVVYVTKGEGRVEVTSNKGDQLLNGTVKEGDVFVVPPFHPHAVVNNGSSPMEWVCIHPSSRFVPSFMAGAKSVYRSMPVEYLAASFNVTEELARKLHRSRENEVMFFKLRQDSALFSILEEFV